jgi:DNA-binding winged helix-turn-helix (wHTH) protein
VALRFGDCRLDLPARRLFRGSREVHASPKAFELLKVLIEARPRALPKAELLERVWPGVFVSDASLARTVTQLRTEVGDPARRPRIIRTVHGYGYAFVADVVEDSPAVSAAPAKSGACFLVLGRRRFRLSDGEHILGRDPDVSVWLDSSKVSRQHARFIVSAGRATIEDLGSKNGTSVRGKPIQVHTPVALEPGDQIQTGPFRLIFRTITEAGSTETAL